MSKQIKFFTPVRVVEYQHKIHNDSSVLTLGSCFSDNIGDKLSAHLFESLINPFGTIFNPISIAKVIEMALNGDIIQPNQINSEGERFFHFDFHSSFDSTRSAEVSNKINRSINVVRNKIEEIDFLILTFGTAIVYRLKEEDRIVSNCHKVPNRKFEKEILDADFMMNSMLSILEKLRRINPSLKVIFTISPVRHTKEGLTENSHSKSKLINLCHDLVKRSEYNSYFPSYEIMVDELRDYRFYKSDLIHPNETAIDIIWSRFMDTYFDKEAIQKVKTIGELNAAMNHRPFDSNSKEHHKFKDNQLKKIAQMKEIYTEVDFQDMIAHFSD